MSWHGIADKATALVAALLTGRRKFFARSMEGAPLTEVCGAVRLGPVAVESEGTREVEAETPAGPLRPAFHVARWLGPSRPTVLYMQGSGERPFDFEARSNNTFLTVLLEAEPAWEANLIVLRAPFHEGTQREYAEAMGELRNFTAMIGCLVALTEALVRALAAGDRGRVLVTGISLGGWATNLHAALHGTADRYAPLLAGAALDDLFLRSGYRRLAAVSARRRPAVLEGALNFESAFRAAPGDRVFPLLARHDRFIRFGPQAASYGDIPVAVIDRGHVTAAASPRLLREHIHHTLFGDEGS